MSQVAIEAALLTENATRCDTPLPEGEVRRIAASVSKYKPAPESLPITYDPAVTIGLSDVEREDVSWLWSRRIPRGRLVALMGDPGVGKSWLSLAVATAITLGAPLPGHGEGREPKRTLLLTAEDGLADTVRPRLEGMGANLDNVKVLTAVRDVEGKERFPDLSKDLFALDSELTKGGYDIVIIDPLNAFLGGDVDTHRDASLRSVLGPLAQLAERHDVAVLFVMHLNKGKRERALYRAQGGIGYVAAARVVLLAGVDPNNPGERALVWLKGNLSEPAQSIGYEIRDGRFAWVGESALTAAHLLGPESEPADVSALAEAEAYLLEILADGPVSANEILKAKPPGVSEKTLRRAKATLRVKSERLGGFAESGGWVWSIATNVAKTANAENVATLDEPISGGSTNAIDHLSEMCSICGSPDISGYSSVDDAAEIAEPRCTGHHVRAADHVLIADAVALGGRIISRNVDRI